MGSARRGCACSTLGLLARDRAFAVRTGSLPVRLRGSPGRMGGARVPRIVDDAGRRGVRERRRVLAHGSRGRVRPGSGRTGARRMGEVVVRGVRPGSSGTGTGPTASPRGSAPECRARAGRGPNHEVIVVTPRRVPGSGGTGTGACRGAASPPTARSLPALPDRSRCGTGPISSRNWTDLGAEPDRSRCGQLSASQGDDAVCTGPGLMGSR